MQPLLKGKGLNLLILRATLKRFRCTHNSHTHWTNVILKIVTAVAEDAEKAFTHWHCHYWYLIARMSGVKEFLVRMTFSYSNLHVLMHSITKIPKFGVQLLGLQVKYTQTGQLHMLPSHQMLGAPEGFNWGTLTNNLTSSFHFFRLLDLATCSTPTTAFTRGLFICSSRLKHTIITCITAWHTQAWERL